MSERVKPTLESPRGRYAGRVVGNVRICTDHYRLTLAVAGLPASVPGQFVQVECREAEHADCGMRNAEGGAGYGGFEWGPGARRPELRDRDFVAPVAFLRRPFSIAGRREGGGTGAGGTPAALRAGCPHHIAEGAGETGGVTEIDIIHRVVGRGTAWLQGLAVGESVSVLGPLGQGFWVPAEMELALLVGGGVGIPPMFYVAEALKTAGKRAVGIVGAQRRDLLPVTMVAGAEVSAAGEPGMCGAEFGAYGFETVVATDDGSLGMKGFVTAALRRLLEAQGGSQKSEARSQKLGRVVVYCCGPTAMMKATARVCAEFGVICQVSLEQPMACGMGTCQSCVIKWRGGAETRNAKRETRNEDRETRNAKPGEASGAGETRNEGEWVYKLTCTDGPVFDSRELQW